MRQDKNMLSCPAWFMAVALFLQGAAATAGTGRGFQPPDPYGLTARVRQPISVDTLKLTDASQTAPTPKTPTEQASTVSAPTPAAPIAAPGARDTASETETFKKGRTIDILFGGSLCPVCLVAFQKRLTATDGVLAAKVEALAETHHTGHPPKRAHANIQFDPDKISQASLVELIKNNDFQFLKATDITQ